jgi:hypothetical protein
VAELKERRPDLARLLREELDRAAALRRYFAADTGYQGGAGDPDLYKFFSQRYRRLLAAGGVLAVVLPRSAFGAKGSTGFRRWMFSGTAVVRLDFLLNNRLWMFDTHPQWTVALVVTRAERPVADHSFEVAGVASSASAFAEQTATPGISLRREALGERLEVPLLRSQAAASLLADLRTPRPGADQLLGKEVRARERAAAVEREIGRARLAFRDVSRATDSRTIRAALVPPQTFLTNKAPYLAFVEHRDTDRAACLGIMNSLAFDWQARRFVETNVNFFILEGLRVPRLDDATYQRVARAAARLSCPDERFTEFAAATGVEVGPLSQDARDELRAEIDALVAHAYRLDEADLETIFADFTLDAVPEAYRERVRDRFRTST